MINTQKQGTDRTVLDDFVGIYSDTDKFSGHKDYSVQNNKYVFNLNFSDKTRDYSAWIKYFAERQETMMSLALLMRIISVENTNISNKINRYIKSNGLITSTATYFDIFLDGCNYGGKIIQDFGSKIIKPVEKSINYIPLLESSPIFIEEKLKKISSYKGISDSSMNVQFGALLKQTTLMDKFSQSIKIYSLLEKLFENAAEDIRVWTLPLGSRKDYPIELVGLNHNHDLNLSRIDLCYSCDNIGHAVGVSVKKK